MKLMKSLAIVSIVAGLSFWVMPRAQAQVTLNFGVNVGPPPVCPYGYYDYAPYNCAPYGYYGPEWFANGIFIGAGPWFRGPRDFHGWVDNRYDPRYGYHGHYPHRGDHEHFDGYHRDHQFHGNEERHGGDYFHDHDDHGHGHGRGH